MNENKQKMRQMKSLTHDIVDSINDILNDRSTELEEMTIGEMSTCLVNAASNVLAQHAHIDYKDSVKILDSTISSIYQVLDKD